MYVQLINDLKEEMELSRGLGHVTRDTDTDLANDGREWEKQTGITPETSEQSPLPQQQWHISWVILRVEMFVLEGADIALRGKGGGGSGEF